MRTGRLPARSGGIVVIAGILLLGALLAWNAGRDHGAAAAVPHADPSVAGTPVVAGDSGCGDGWSGGSAGTLTFAVWNASNNPVEVYLRDVRTDEVYLDVENLGTGATRSAQVTLAPGRYAFVCLPSEGPPVSGATQQVTGSTPAAATAGVVPITENDLAPAVRRYQAWVRRQLPGLLAQTGRLAADVRAGDVAAAKRDWLTAHLTYQRLGAAYGAFGEDDSAIDGLPSTTVPAARDRRLHGFHKIEALLWSGRGVRSDRTTGLAREADALLAAEHHLHTDLARQDAIQPIDVGLRAHEILEDAVQQVLTGADDAGSHTQLATLDADIDGTWAALDQVRPLLRSRDPELARTLRWLRRTQALVRGYRHGAHWVPLERLGRLQRETLDAHVEQAVELLSRVAVITDPRRSAG
ncbi:EfeM/EfeO family lipoprotein [Nocardioides maradonensis]